jgi:hypothetical protein
MRSSSRLRPGHFEAVTLSGARLYVLAVIEHANRERPPAPATARPAGRS